MQTNQIKSKKRVKDRGEVFTNPREVKAMCDLIPKDVWENIDSRFLEPTCGTGNFLVEILERKLSYCKSAADIIRAVKSIWAIDIMQDNVETSRKRMIEMCSEKVVQFTKDVTVVADVMCACLEILQAQIIQGDSLEIQKKWEEEECPKSSSNVTQEKKKTKRSSTTSTRSANHTS